MKRIIENIIFGIMWLFSLLPFCILYFFSDITLLLMWNVFKYRKKVVMDNLTHAFPEKSESEIRSIAKKFYRHLCDIIFETIKLASISQKSIKKHFDVADMDIVNQVFDNKRQLMLLMGHYGNWEWLSSFPIYGMKSHPMSVYKKVEEGVFEKIMFRMRSRFGVEMVPMQVILRNIIGKVQSNTYSLINLIADQNPAGGGIRLWMPFMGREVPVFTGGEAMARRFDMVVGYLSIKSIKRGYYRVNIDIISEDVNSLPDNEVMRLFIEKLEEDIRECPEQWLWTHRRWRHKKSEMR